MSTNILPMQTSLSPEERKKMEVSKTFDIAEKPIMEFMCEYYSKLPTDLFIEQDILKINTDSLLIYPIDEYSSSKYILLTLKLVPYDYVTKIPDVLKSNEDFKNSLGFISYSVNEVFNAIIRSNIKSDFHENLIRESIHLEFEGSNYTFLPYFIYPQRRYKLMYEEIIGNFENALKQIAIDKLVKENIENPDVMQNIIETEDNYTKQLNEVKTILSKLVFDEDSANEQEKNVNDLNSKVTRIGIEYDEKIFDELEDHIKESILKYRNNDKTSRIMEI